MREKIVNLSEKLRNPFAEMLGWMKGEIMDLQALVEAISFKSSMEGASARAESKAR